MSHELDEVLGFDVKGTTCKIRYDRSGALGWWLIASIKKYCTLRVTYATREPPPVVPPEPSEGFKQEYYIDPGNKMQQRFRKFKDWQEDVLDKMVEPILSREAEKIIRYGEACGMSQGKLNEILNKEETKMSDYKDYKEFELTNPTFIGNRRADDLSVNDVLGYVVKLQEYINGYKDMDVKCDTVTKIIKDLKSKKRDIVEYLDEREVE